MRQGIFKMDVHYIPNSDFQSFLSNGVFGVETFPNTTITRYFINDKGFYGEFLVQKDPRNFFKCFYCIGYETKYKRSLKSKIKSFLKI